MANKVDEKIGVKELDEIGTIGHIADMVRVVQDEILDRRDVKTEQLIFMTRNDGQARGILNAVKNPIKMARAKIKAAVDGDIEAKFIEDNLLSPSLNGGMEIPVNILASTMALAVRDGYKIFEKVWEVRGDRKIWLKKLAYRSNLSTDFKYDDHGNISGAIQRTQMSGYTREFKFDVDKIAYFIHNIDENPYKGESDFFPVFYHYDKKHKLYAIAHLAYQLNAVPIRIGKHPASLQGKGLNDFRRGLESLGTTVAMTFPSTCSVDSFESNRSLTEFLYLIRHHDGMMSRAFLTQFMNLGQEGSGGSFALSSDQSNLFLMALIGLLHDIADVFNRQIIPQLIDWNFGTKKYPTLIFVPFSDSVRSVIIETFKAMLTAKNPSISWEFALELEKSVAEELGLQLDYKAIEKRIKKEREELAKTMAQPAQQPGKQLQPGQTQDKTVDSNLSPDQKISQVQKYAQNPGSRGRMSEGDVVEDAEGEF